MKTVEIWYCWRVLTQVEGEKEKRLLVPWSDPYEYEFAFDFLYETEAQAIEGLKTMGAQDDAHEQGWILCRATYEALKSIEEVAA